MWTSNNALVPDPDKEDILASKPLDWPFLKLGLRMCGWGDGQIKFYLLGTPIIWWGSTIALGVGIAVVLWYVARMQRQYRDWKEGEWEQWLWVGKMAFGGWALHFCELRTDQDFEDWVDSSTVLDYGPGDLPPPLCELAGSSEEVAH